MIVLVPVALVSAVSALRALSREGSEFLLDERMLWLYSVLAVYVPAGLSVSFFWTRIFFEASIPGLLVALGELDSLSSPETTSVGTPLAGISSVHGSSPACPGFPDPEFPSPLANELLAPLTRQGTSSSR